VRSVRAVLLLVIGVPFAGQGIANAAKPTTVHRASTQSTSGGNNTASVSGEIIQLAAAVRNSYGDGEPNAQDGEPAGDPGKSPGDDGKPTGDAGQPTAGGGKSNGDGVNSAGGGGKPKGGKGKPGGGGKPKGGKGKPGGGGNAKIHGGKPTGDGGVPTSDDGDPGPVNNAGNNADPPAPSSPVPTVQNLTRSVATSRAKSVLSRRFGRVFTRGNHKRVSCRRRDANSYFCSLSWRYHRKRYDGHAIVSRSGVVKTHVVSRRR
jgi:hypothetical protein